MPAQHVCVEPCVDERYVICIAIEGDEIVGAVFLKVIHRGIKDLCLFIMVLGQKLCDAAS